MSYQKNRELTTKIEILKEELNSLEQPYDFSQVENQLNNLKKLYNEIEGLIEFINNDIESENQNKGTPLINKFKENKDEFEILKKEYHRKVNEISTIVDQILLMRGELHGEEKENAQKNMALQQLKILDEHGNLLEGIAKNVEEAIENIKKMKVELKNQDEQLGKINDKAIKIKEQVDDTEKIFNKISQRALCRKITLSIGIVILFIFNLLMLYFTIAKGVGLPPFKKSEVTQSSNILKEPISNEPKEISGIKYDLAEDLDLNELDNKGLSFISLKLEEDTSIQDKIISYIDKAKEKNIKVAIYWHIKQKEEIDMLEEANKAFNFLKELKEKGKDLQLGFYFKFDKDNDLQTNYNIVNKLCENIEYDCGVVLTYSNFKTNYKDNLDSITEIKNYWINPEGESIDDSFKKLITIWNTPESISIKDNTYNIIKSIEKNK